MITEERSHTIAAYCQESEAKRYLGSFRSEDLQGWLEHELGSAEILDGFQPIHGALSSMAVANSPVLHILSGNTPHAAFQSVLRGLIVGAENRVKLPASGLPELQQWIKGLPPTLRRLIKILKPDCNILDEINQAKTVIVIGSDEAINAIHKQIKPQQRFIPHGHKLSIGLIDQPNAADAELAVKDACAFNQQGCLSLHTIYVRENAPSFLPLVANAMASYEKAQPRGSISLSESGAITNLRKSILYEAANNPKQFALAHSQEDTSWTVIYRDSPTLTPSPLNRVLFIQPWPEDISLLGPERSYISTLAIGRGLAAKSALFQSLLNHEIPRICLLGKAQEPSLFWHHDGFSPLAELIRWKDQELPLENE